MERSARPERVDLPLPSPQLMRTLSRASDRGERTPSISGSTLITPPPISPDPAYIALSAAAHVINSELVDRGMLDGEDVEPEEAATVSPSALTLINSFLDQLLYSFLANSRSTSILSLRPAISEVLKPRLAKEAIDGADEELQGYMAGGDDEELLDFHNGQELQAGSNLFQIFRRTRLRCMVYTRLGDMEEDDEETYLEGATPQEEGHRLSRDLGTVSPAAAIFLTSIIEFIGEQALMVAAENAFNRTATTAAKKRGLEPEPLIVDDRDVEKIAFNRILGRLWRSWKRKGRVNSLVSPRKASYDQVHRKTQSERPSRATSVSERDGAPSYFDEDAQQHSSVAGVLQKGMKPRSKFPPHVEILPAEPGLEIDDEARKESKGERERPRSMVDVAKLPNDIVETPKGEHDDDGRARSPATKVPPPTKRTRSSSLPATRTTPYSSPTTEAFTTPTEGPDPLATSPKNRSEAEKELPQLTDDSQKVFDPSNKQKVFTMYDGLLERESKPIPIDANLLSREVTAPGESNRQGDLDADLTPQPLSFKQEESSKPTDGSLSKRRSHVSTLSSNYSFQAGQQSPSPSVDHISREALLDDSSDNYPTRGASLEKSRDEPENAAATQGRVKSNDESGNAPRRDVSKPHEDDSRGAAIFDPRVANSIPEDDEAPTASISNRNDIAQAGIAYYDDLPPSGIVQNQFSEVDDVRRPPVPTSAGTERASVQRVSPPTSAPRDTASYANRPSMSSNIEGRPITSNSVTSLTKGKGMTSRESNDLGGQAIIRGTSSEVKRELTNGSKGSARSSDKEQDFEELIRSDQTIQYTLTPQNMREIEKPDSPRWGSKQASGDTESLIIPRSPVSPVASDRPSSDMKSSKGLNGLRAQPTQGTNIVTSQSRSSPTSTKSPTSMTSQSQPAPKSSGAKSKGVVAREATSPKESSMQDFADFIRSTGPDSDPRSLAKSATDNRPAPHSRAASSSSQSGPMKQASRKITKPSPGAVPRKREPPPTPTPAPAPAPAPLRSAPKLKARDPIASPTNTTAELADFFRTAGPPDAHMSPRSNAASQPDGKLRDGVGSAASATSTQDSFPASKLTQSSGNSRTALLDSTNRGASKTNSSSSRSNDMPGGGPVRKQRRVKDPYAIDSDDEDDPYANSVEPEREEESLSDFLKNYPPPAGTNDRPRNTISTSPPSSAVADGKQGKGPSMRERLARNIAVIPESRPSPPKKNHSKLPPSSSTNDRRHASPPQRKSANTTTTSSPTSQRSHNQPPPPKASTAAAPQLPPLNSVANTSTNTNTSPNVPRATSPHLTQNGSKFDTYRPSQPTYAKHMDRAPNPNRPKFQARDESGMGAGAGHSGIADLADFLRETEPPAPSGPIGGGGAQMGKAMQPGFGNGPAMRPGGQSNGAGREKEDGGWRGMFGRRKKSLAHL